MEAAFQSGIASASLQVILERFATFALNEIGLILGVDDELRKLEKTLLKIQALVDLVEDSHAINNTKAWQVWLEDLKKLSYDADDLLDEISLELSRFKSKSHPQIYTNKTQVRDMVFSTFKLGLPHEISKLQKELEGIASEMDSFSLTQLIKFGFPRRDMGIQLGSTSCGSSSVSLVEEMNLIGREKQKEEIVEMLLTEDVGGNNVSVIPIVGMGGLGKTTLAQIVYNNEEIVKDFDLRMWVYVSVDFDVIRITKSIIESATERSCKLLDLDPIQVTVQKLLRGKKFLLVLDDLWNENYGDWDVLRAPFRVGLRGSKILVTTRSSIVSLIVGTTPPYYLPSLSDEDCWKVMKQRAFLNWNSDENERFEVIGKKIAKKCDGLPLAAKTLGSVLHSKTSEKDWDTLLRSELWDLPQDKNEIFPALRLSYHHLPTHLKRCFVYCSIFPCNHEFEIDNLVLVWMAEGLIQPVGEQRLEDIGSDYFSDLLWRCFFQYSHVNIHNQPVYKMHDVIHSMAQFISAGMCFRMENDKGCWYPMFRNVRHLSLNHKNIQHITSKPFDRCRRRLRTFLVMCEDGACVGQIPSDLFLKLGRLRMLDLSCIGIDELPDSIDHLKHLRYLNLSENRFQKLPESIDNLVGLQTLKLRNCFELLELPKNLKNLTNLRHLDLDVKRQLNSMPSELGRLINLQTLSAFIVGKEKGRSVAELKNMRFLRGSICITNLENVMNVMEAKEAMLDKKPHLNKVEFQWNNFGDRFIQQEVLAGLQPHENVKELQVTNYGGIIFPSWLSDPLSCKLVSIHLQSCQRCTILPPLGQLPLLKSLYIESMGDLVNVDHRFCGFGTVRGFPSLESLKFHDMPNLTAWKGLSPADMPCLLELTIVDCPRLVTLPLLHNLSCLENLDISRCPKLQSLPEEGLPTSLKTLIIVESVILKERCKVEEGEDWCKIKTIQKIEIDYIEIPRRSQRI